MIRKKEDQAIAYKCIRGGIGEVEMHKICESVEELYGKGRLFNLMVLAPGNTIGEHTHEGDNEIFYFLSGTGEYNDNGTIVEKSAPAIPPSAAMASCTASRTRATCRSSSSR